MTDSILQELKNLHDKVDRLAAKLVTIHKERLVCSRGCYDCCVDEITVFEIEAERIRLHAPELLTDGTPHPPGRCAFLSEEGVCRIYEARPYVCRTQGLPFRWIGETDDGSLAELRDICQLNEDGEPVENLRRHECWTIGPFEEELAALQCASDGGQARRVGLRSLFERYA